jgi:hypothetical protein
MQAQSDSTIYNYLFNTVTNEITIQYRGDSHTARVDDIDSYTPYVNRNEVLLCSIQDDIISIKIVRSDGWVRDYNVKNGDVNDRLNLRTAINRTGQWLVVFFNDRRHFFLTYDTIFDEFKTSEIAGAPYIA